LRAAPLLGVAHLMKKTALPDTHEAALGGLEPGHPTLWASLAFALATLTLAWPGLTGKILFNPASDQYTNGYGFRHFAEEWLRDGKGIPQWNPFLQGGVPYVAGMHGDVFYPTFLLRMLIGTAEGITWEFPIHIFLAGLFTYLFLRAWRLPFVASVIGGLAYMMSGSLAGLALPGHDGKLFVAALFPLCLHLLTLGIRDGRNWAWGAFALAIGFALLSPHPQLFQYLLLVAGSYALFLAFTAHDGVGKLPTAVAARRLCYAAGGVAVGLLIGAIQFAPLLAYKAYSPRAAGHDWAIATSYSFPIEELINVYLPQFSGILEKYWGRNAIHLHSEYIGAAVLVLAGAAFGRAWTGARKRFFWFWIGTGTVALLWALGGNTPFFQLVYAIVPGTKYFRAPSTIFFITTFAVAVLSALGAERLLAGRLSARYAYGWLIGAGVMTLVALAGGFGALAQGLVESPHFTDMFPANPSDVVTALIARIDANAGDVKLGALRSLAFAALACGTIIAVARKRLSPRIAGWALMALCAVDLWSIERFYWQYMPPASQTFASDPAIDAIKADVDKTGPGRTLVLAAGSGLDALDPFFRKKGLMAHFVRTVEGEQGNELGAYNAMVSLDSGRVVLQPTFWRHENAQYLYTGLTPQQMSQASAQMTIPAFTTLAGPVRNANGSMVYAYRIGLADPLAWVASGAVKASPEQALPTVLDTRYDPTTFAIVDTSTTFQATSVASLAPSSNRATVRSYEAGRVSIDLVAPATAGSLLVLSENYYPGWTATSGSSPLRISRVNYNLIGVELPAGAQHIEASFYDPNYGTGKTVTLAALFVAAVLLVVGVVADRRRREPGAVGV
jgi:hypothetical protein